MDDLGLDRRRTPRGPGQRGQGRGRRQAHAAAVAGDAQNRPPQPGDRDQGRCGRCLADGGFSGGDHGVGPPWPSAWCGPASLPINPAVPDASGRTKPRGRRGSPGDGDCIRAVWAEAAGGGACGDGVGAARPPDRSAHHDRQRATERPRSAAESQGTNPKSWPVRFLSPSLAVHPHHGVGVVEPVDHRRHRHPFRLVLAQAPRPIGARTIGAGWIIDRKLLGASEQPAARPSRAAAIAGKARRILHARPDVSVTADDPSRSLARPVPSGPGRLGGALPRPARAPGVRGGL